MCTICDLKDHESLTKPVPQRPDALGIAPFQEEATVGAEEGNIAGDSLAPEGNNSPQGSVADTALNGVTVSTVAVSTVPLGPTAKGGGKTRSWTCTNKPSVIGNASSPLDQRAPLMK